MSLWQITKSGVSQAEVFDDGVWAQPGEDGFSQDAVRAHVTALGPTYGFNYIGRSPDAAPAEPPPEESGEA